VEVLDHILHGFVVAIEPMNLLFLFIGAVMGTIVGLLPGIGPSAGVALLLPATFGIDPLAGLIMLAGIYYGSQFGNSTAAILINTPGTASAAMTTLDGYPMAKAGRAGAALAIAAIGGFVAGTLGIVLLSVLAVPLAAFALRFGPAEYFTLMLFAMTAVSSLTGPSLSKGLISAILGLMLATVGVDLQSGLPRYTLGVPEFQDGIGFVVMIIGLFAVAEVLQNVERWFKGELTSFRVKGGLWLTREERRRSVKPILRGGIIGFLVGVLPGAGATIATFISYAAEKRFSKHPEQFGKGAIEGVAGPEAANNASTCGAFVPMLTLGVPGSGTTAVLLSAFILYGIQPGPLLFQDHPDLVWGLIDSMYLGNIILLVLNLPLVGLFARILYAPPGILLALIMGIASIGVYSINTNVVDLYLLLFFGVVGYTFNKLEIPIPPMVLALVLGGTMEQSFRQALAISQASPVIFVSSSICIVFLALTALSVAVPTLVARVDRLRAVTQIETD
jgi:putative tricarboxylic transport membrane protein